MPTDFIEVELSGQKIKIERRDGKYVKPDILKRQSGFGSALKPAREDWILVQKPREGTYVDNALKWGVAGLNIDGGRIATEDDLTAGGNLVTNTGDERTGKALGMFQQGTPNTYKQNDSGRWPANFTHDGSEEVVREFPESKSTSAPRHNSRETEKSTMAGKIHRKGGFVTSGIDDEGSAARFFYSAKASRSERNLGLDGMEEKEVPYSEYRDNFKDTKDFVTHYPDGTKRPVNKTINNHPTVKSLALMEYLVRLTKTPTGGKVLDPFLGSGTTGMACVNEGREFVGIELDPDYFEIACKRIQYSINLPRQPRLL